MASYLVTGGTGFIGKGLMQNIVDAEHEAVVLTRHPERHQETFGTAVRYIREFSEIENTALFDIVINLGGEGIGDKHWTDKRKQVLRESRIGLTNELVVLLGRLESKPALMISASAIGWYGAQDAAPLTERSSFNPEFTHDICQEWEAAASAVADLGVRLCIVRMGLVLGKNGGVLKRMLPPFYFGLGGRMGSGEQMMSWIHIEDVIRAVNFLVEKKEQGVFNLTAPGAASNAEFTQALGQAISRPTILLLPGFILKTIFGEMGERLLLKGQNVVPQQLLDKGFVFEYPDLDKAFSDIFIR